MGFIRFVLAKRDPDSGVEEGLFQLAYRMRDDHGVSVADRAELQEQLEWFERNLTTPERFNRSGSKGYYRRNTRGIAWFKDTSAECVARMHRLKQLLESYGYSVNVIRETRVGYVVYEDELQMVAEPFADTNTRGE